MKVLLTGASGFVGSHILDALCARGIDTAVLLRPTSDQRFLSVHLPKLKIHNGSITEPASLAGALCGITRIIHCAGCTRARQNSDFDAINHLGTRNLVEAANAAGSIERFVHISSLAVSGPATPARPAREDDPPRPLSAYGKSKLAAETVVRAQCRSPFTIIRPPAVYGPRDYAFLPMFTTVQRHICPRPSRTQALSLVFVRDLAAAVVACLEQPAAAGRTYFAAGEETITARGLACVIARRMGCWTVPLPLPPAILWPVCFAEEVFSRLTGRATLLNLQKFAELRAPGWVCDSSRLRQEVGYTCRTTIEQGVTETLTWYRDQGWLPRN